MGKRGEEIVAMDSQPPAAGGDSTPIRVRGVRALTYRLEGRALVTYRRSLADREGGNDLRRRPEPGWVLDGPAVELAFVLGAVKVQVRDACTGAVHECSMEHCFRRSTLVRCPGGIRLRHLPLGEWVKERPGAADRAVRASCAFGAA